MALDVKVPPVGESVQEAMIHKWRKAAGDFVKRDEVLMDLETDKATVEVTAEAEGVLEVLRNEGDTVAIGEVIARIDTNAKGATKPSATPPPPPVAKAPAAKAEPAKAPTSDAPTMPAARRMATENNVNLADVAGTGKGGRVTKGMEFVDMIKKGDAARNGEVSNPDKIISMRRQGTSIGFGAEVRGPDDRRTGEVLRDDSLLFHDKLKALGGQVVLSAIDGMEHVAVVRSPDLVGSAETFEAVADFVDGIIGG